VSRVHSRFEGADLKWHFPARLSYARTNCERRCTASGLQAIKAQQSSFCSSMYDERGVSFECANLAVKIQSWRDYDSLPLGLAMTDLSHWLLNQVWQVYDVANMRISSFQITFIEIITNGIIQPTIRACISWHSRLFHFILITFRHSTQLNKFSSILQPIQIPALTTYVRWHFTRRWSTLSIGDLSSQSVKGLRPEITKVAFPLPYLARPTCGFRSSLIYPLIHLPPIITLG